MFNQAEKKQLELVTTGIAIQHFIAFSRSLQALPKFPFENK